VVRASGDAPDDDASLVDAAVGELMFSVTDPEALIQALTRP